MSKIKSFKIEMRPFTNRGDDWYEIRVRQNDEVFSMSRVAANQLPHEAEIEMLTRMGTDIIRGLRDRANHSGCCNCCEKKSKCCANTCHI